MVWYNMGIDFENPKRKGRFERIPIDTKKLFQKYGEGVKITKIAEDFEVSEATIKRHLKFLIPDFMKRNKGRTENPNTSFNESIIKLYTNDHYSTIKIADQLGCSAEKVRRRLIKCGVEMRKSSYKNLLEIHPSNLNRKEKEYPFEDLKDFNESLLMLYCLNFEREDIARYLNIHVDTVVRRINFVRSLYAFKLRVCKICDGFFRFIVTESKRNSNICPLCMSKIKNRRGFDLPEGLIEILETANRGGQMGDRERENI